MYFRIVKSNGCGGDVLLAGFDHTLTTMEGKVLIIIDQMYINITRIHNRSDRGNNSSNTFKE